MQTPVYNPANFCNILTLLFIGLKLSGYIATWSWLAVLSPTIISLTFMTILILSQ